MAINYAFDPEIATGLTDFLTKYPPEGNVEKGNWKKLRDDADILLENMFSIYPNREDITIEKFITYYNDGTEIPLYWYTPQNAKSQSAVVYIHGGGRIAGSADIYEPLIKNYVYRTGVSFLAVGYRLAPEVHGKRHSEDAFEGLLWLKENADKLGIDQKRIAIMGDSGGGGVAAGAAILSRNQNIELAMQILIYPMLDSRTIVANEKLLPFALWNYDANFTGWEASLSEELNSPNISPIAVPAYLADFENLAPMYTEVGFLDIFRDETLAYAQQLSKIGVPVEFHLHPGAPHAFEIIAPNSSIAKRAMLDRIRIIRSI
ncbi:MAG TPA: alpha/beta hydrolase [Arachidicoccus sp.]